MDMSMQAARLLDKYTTVPSALDGAYTESAYMTEQDRERIYGAVIRELTALERVTYPY